MTVLNASEWGTESGLTPSAYVSIETERGSIRADALRDRDGETAAVDLMVTNGGREESGTLTLADASTLVTALIDMGAEDGRAGERMGPGLRAKAAGHERLAASSPARNNTATRYALQALRAEHPDEYDALRRAWLANINHDEGPLPGDEQPS
jgi:hypothetical protein